MERQGLTACAFIALLPFFWAAPTGAALSIGSKHADEKTSKLGELRREATIVRPVRLRNIGGRGLLIDVWLNSTGPYVFALDTGAGQTLIRSEVLRQAGTAVPSKSKGVAIGGLSRTTISGEQVTISRIAVGDKTNLLPTPQQLIVVPSLPTGVDGILDPTAAYAPMGYVINMPRRELQAFDTSTSHLQLGNEPQDGAVVRWIKEKNGKRPFVRLGDNRLALIDTGSGLGLAVTYDAMVTGNHSTRINSVRDLGGGVVQSKRVEPTTVSIGSLVLRKVPTDILIGAHEDAPVILGRVALAPFRLTFDPVRQLIEIAPSSFN